MAISPEEYKLALLAFAQRVPELLARHGATAPLALEVQKLELERQLERRFTVAVIGRMRSGKSTLLNALIGKRRAPVGVNETTATVNFFDHGTGEKEQQFDIHWRRVDRDVTVGPIARADRLVRNRRFAKRVDLLRFYVDSAFLKGVRLVDTPGTMSNIESDEATTMGFLTARHAERADAVVIVLPTIVGGADKKVLELVEGETRLPGQGPYNTIAVLQKWEALNVPAPELEAQRLAGIFRQGLEGKVAEVLPVSGLLGLMAKDVPEEALDRLAYLATHADEPQLRSLTAMDGRFGLEREGVPLSGAERQALFTAIRDALSAGQPDQVEGTFPMVKYALFLAHRRELDTGAKLRAGLREASNLDRFKELLERRFFSRAGLIQANTVLTKALDPCKVGLLSLKDGLERRRELARTGAEVEAALAQLSAGDQAAFLRLKAYVEASLPLLRDQVDPIERTLRELDQLVYEAERDGRMLVADIECLELLADPSLPLSPEDARMARQICGQSGMEMHDRLGLEANATQEVLCAEATERHARFARHRWSPNERTRKLAEHIDDRLSRILDRLEA
jgi:hypothetical protein